MKLVDALVISLRDWGVDFIFGVSGANIEHLHDAVYRLGEGRIEAVLTKSEVGASFMADGRARVHGKLGVCCSTSGGGMMNLAVGIAEAYAESVPVLAIVGQSPSQFNGKGGFQDSSGIGRSVNAVGLWKSITKYTALVDQPELFWDHLRAAVSAALGGRQAPAALLIPRDMWELDVGDKPSDFPETLDELTEAHSPLNELAIGYLFEKLRSASNPVLMMGTGIARSQSGRNVRLFAQECGIPVVTTMGNTAIFPHDDYLFLGTVGVAGHPSAHDYLNEKADLIVAVGTGLNALTRGPLEQALQRAHLAVVNVDPGEINRIVPGAHCIVADAGQAFGELRKRASARPFYHGTPKRYGLSRFVSQLAPSIKAGANDIPSDILLQSQAIEVLNKYLPASGHLLFDAGNCAATAMHYLKIPQGCSTTIALGMGGMGYAISAKVEMETTIAWLGTHRDSHVASIEVVVQNKGAVRLYIEKLQFAVRSIDEDSDLKTACSETYPRLMKQLFFPESVVDEGLLFPQQWNYAWVDPGCVDTYRHPISVPKSARFAMVWVKLWYPDDVDDFQHEQYFCAVPPWPVEGLSPAPNPGISQLS